MTRRRVDYRTVQPPLPMRHGYTPPGQLTDFGGMFDAAPPSPPVPRDPHGFLLNVLPGFSGNSAKARIPLPVAESLVTEFTSLLPARAMAAGSIRRRKPTVGDIDLLYWGNPCDATRVPGVERVMGCGSKKADLVWNGVQFNVYHVEDSYFAPMLMFLTGSGEHNMHLRFLAKRRGMKLNQYGLWGPGDMRLDDNTEVGVYSRLGTSYKEPWERG